MLRQRVLKKWKTCKEIFSKLKAKSIDNYPIMNKRAILGLDNKRSDSPLTLCNFTIANGEVINKRDSYESQYSVEINTELLKVAILENLTDIDDVDHYCLVNLKTNL